MTHIEVIREKISTIQKLVDELDRLGEYGLSCGYRACLSDLRIALAEASVVLVDDPQGLTR